jgi:hypothetical protein
MQRGYHHDYIDDACMVIWYRSYHLMPGPSLSASLGTLVDTGCTDFTPVSRLPHVARREGRQFHRVRAAVR